MRVKLVLPQGADRPGGISRYADQLAKALRRNGTIVEPARLRYLPGAGRREVLRAFPIGVEGAIEGDIVHLPGIVGSAVLLVGRRSGPAVVTVHDLGALYCPEDVAIGTAIDRRILQLSLRGVRRADRVLAVSDFTRNCLLQTGFAEEQVVTVHEGVDHDRFQPRPGARETIERRFGLDLAGGPVVLYVGSEWPRKNLATLVRALGQLKRDGVRFRWLKVGASGYAPGRSDLLAQVAREGLADDVSILDVVSDDDLPLLYSAADVYVQPSVWEGFGLPVLEAMACGTPVVATRRAALPEVVGDAGVLVEARDGGALADAVAGVLADPAGAARYAAAGLARARDWSWERTARATAAVYSCVAR